MEGKVTSIQKLQDHAPVGNVEKSIYAKRFSTQELQTRQSVWRVLCQDFFQRFVNENDVVVDLGAGDGLFITNIQARKRIAVDINPEVQSLVPFGVTVLQSDATSFAGKLPCAADVVFLSNFLEHLPHKSMVLQVLEECRAALRPGGKVIILQPNIRYVGAAYWDYIDHHIALTEHSLQEALEVSGFQIETLIPRFLPYTVKSRLGRFGNLIRWYLKMPFMWRVFGAQTLIIGKKIGQ